MYWALFPSIKIRIPWDIVLIKQVLPEIMPFYLKWQFCLDPIAKYMHFREKPSVFYEFDDKYISFLQVLNLSFNYNPKTLGYRFSESWCCQKIMLLYLKCKFWLRPMAKCVYFRWKSSVLYEFDDKCIVFLHVLYLSPSIMITKPRGTGSVNGDVARKLSCFFT